MVKRHLLAAVTASLASTESRMHALGHPTECSLRDSWTSRSIYTRPHFILQLFLYWWVDDSGMLTWFNKFFSFLPLLNKLSPLLLPPPNFFLCSPPVTYQQLPWIIDVHNVQTNDRDFPHLFPFWSSWAGRSCHCHSGHSGWRSHHVEAVWEKSIKL